MKKVAYYILALPFYVLALLPFPLFYLLCSFLYYVGYYLIGYRKKVIFQNLSRSFPQYSHEQIVAVAKKYYGFMIDTSLEAFKVLAMSKSTLRKRVVVENWDLIEPLRIKQQPFLFVMGHYGNWEWMGQGLQLSEKVQVDTLYQPLSNGFFDWLISSTRSKYGIHLIPMKSSLKEMIRRSTFFSGTIFLADQSPSNLDACHWMEFLNQDTPVFLGTERIAKKLNRPVVFIHTYRVKRGYYRVRFSLITDLPNETAPNWITEQHTRMLEQDIKQQPELWLWSHRRWKHKRRITE
ncbi:MAG: lysophospholipid acyltransferase family protein [Bacteroidia bacterium]|jgi:KDO2-lipid IV(A) lauroyltransferase|nr:lysophospholipid acyltransferase family protein [Bacteroidia bacterium]